jgi:UMF1 family MFS transporter
LSRSAFTWSIYEGCRDPYFGLVAGWVFMPYFASIVVGDPVQGQALVAKIGQLSGFAAALTAPLLGATIDRLGPRKPLLLVSTVLVAPLIWCLWFATPGAGGLPVPVVAGIITLIAILLAYNDVLYGSMLSIAAAPAERSVASGLAMSLGNVSNFCLAVFVLWALMLPGKSSWPLIPAAPLFGLSAARHEPERLVAPLVATLFALGSIPLFLWAKDAQRTGLRLGEATRSGIHSLFHLLKDARLHRDPMIYLLARTLSLDAGTSFFMLGGVYAAGVMHWGATELLVYGILGSIAGILGGIIAAWMDLRFGPKAALQLEIAGSILGILGEIGTSPLRIFGVPISPQMSHAVLWNAPAFRTSPDLIFVGCAFLVFLFQTGAWSSHRTLLTRLAPPDRIGAFFGLAALSGSATVWLGPLLAGICTEVFHSQQAGFAPIAVLFLFGLILLFFIRGGGAERPVPPN